MKLHHFTLMAFLWAALLLTPRTAEAQGNPATYLTDDCFTYDDGIITS